LYPQVTQQKNERIMRTLRYWPIVATLAVVSAPLYAQAVMPLDSATLAGFSWRPIGPANMSGRVTDIEGIPYPSKTFYVAAAAGGIWKTTNAGTTFRPIFTNQRVVSLGDIAIAPSDTNTIWAGTGEEDSRNSISPGGGVYKSTDGGLTWEIKGLVETQAIGRIVIHPTNPDIVYVAALGHTWDSNPERGLYKTTDGGETWELSKFVSDKAGFVDVAMHPSDPNTLFAASWERVRGPYFLQSGGPGSALWKTTDGGQSWTKVEGGGFPETTLGRIGIAISLSNPDIIYTMVEADSGNGHTTRPSGLYRSEDGGQTWEKTASNNVRPFYYSQVRVDPKNPDRVYWSSTPVNFSDDGGRTVGNATIGVHVDHHAMWIDPNDPEHFIVGNDGGVAQTWDRGGNYDVLNTIPVGQFYAVSYNMDVPYGVCGGLQDNGTWCGPSRLSNGSITNHNWYSVSGGDGFVTAQDPDDPNLAYAESQGGNMVRVNVATGESSRLQKPDWRQTYSMYEDSIIIEWPDTTVRPHRNTRRQIEVWRERQSADSTALDLRWNWNTPFFISVHNPKTFYAGANRVLKSTQQGDDLYPISPDLTTQDAEKIRISTQETGGITPDVTGAETYCTIVSLAESPIRPGILYAGTDDGNVWLTRNDGGNWEELTGRFPGLPENAYVSRIEPSHHDSSRFYVSFDNHRVNDFTPYVYVTDDFGQTFRSIAASLPVGGPDFVHVIREDPHNPDLLFAGTDVGVYVSLDRGNMWQRFMTGLPTVPVHDLKIHPRDRELIAGTHGRAIWIVDIAPLEQMNATVLAASAYLFEPDTAFQFGRTFVGGESVGQKWFEAQSPEYGAEIAYRLAGGDRRSRPTIVITDVTGDTIQTIEGTGGPGIHRVYWNFRGKAPPRPELSPSERRDSILSIRRIEQVFDSLAQNTDMPEAMLNRMRDQMLSGDTRGLFRAFGGGFGGRQQSTGFQERPGESQPRQAAGAGASGQTRGGQGQPAGGPTGGMDRNQMMEIMRAIRRPGQRGFGGPGGAGQAPLVGTGDYLVTITVDGVTMSQVLRVEQLVAGAGGFPF
jgi:photosystem II stability/assembly factor-like uncharacterized protein